MRRFLKFKYLWPTVASASLAGNAYMLHDRYYPSSDPQKVILHAFSTFAKTPEPKQTFASVAVQALNNLEIPMYGKEVVDQVTDPVLMPGRRQYEAHPYRKAGAGSNVIPLYNDGTDTYVLLGRKYVNPRRKELGLVDQYILLGGYMQPHRLETTATQAVKDLESEAKDEIEEGILRGDHGYTKKTAQSMTVSTKADEFDINLEAAAGRELAEEGGLVAADAKAIYPSGTYSTYPLTNDPRLHTIVQNYVFDFGANKPFAKPGSDIAEVVWVNVKKITRDLSDLSKYSIKLDNGNSAKLRDGYGPMLDDAIRIYEEKEKAKLTVAEIWDQQQKLAQQNDPQIDFPGWGSKCAPKR